MFRRKADDDPGANLLDETTRRIGFVGPQIPTRLAVRLLSCSLEAPTTVRTGQQSRFRFHVRNLAPTSLVLDLPAGRSWGWLIGDVPEAGVGQYDPPEEPTRLAFSPLERRTFSFKWDGLVRERTNGHDVWTPSPGTHRMTAYLAVERWRSRGIYATEELEVIDQ